MLAGSCWNCDTWKKNILGVCPSCGRFPSTMALDAYQEGIIKMTVKTQKFARKPFVVDAVKVTPENIGDVARWCGGSVERTRQGSRYIKIDVKNPLTERQTKAFVDDWVLKANTSFKVYTDRALFNGFDRVLEEDEGVDESSDPLADLLMEIKSGATTIDEVLDILHGKPNLEVVPDIQESLRQDDLEVARLFSDKPTDG